MRAKALVISYADTHRRPDPASGASRSCEAGHARGGAHAGRQRHRRLKQAGAAEVVPEIMEGSLMLASHATDAGRRAIQPRAASGSARRVSSAKPVPWLFPRRDRRDRGGARSHATAPAFGRHDRRAPVPSGRSLARSRPARSGVEVTAIRRRTSAAWRPTRTRCWPRAMSWCCAAESPTLWGRKCGCSRGDAAPAYKSHVAPQLVSMTLLISHPPGSGLEDRTHSASTGAAPTVSTAEKRKTPVMALPSSIFRSISAKTFAGTRFPVLILFRIDAAPANC